MDNKGGNINQFTMAGVAGVISICATYMTMRYMRSPLDSAGDTGNGRSISAANQ